MKFEFEIPDKIVRRVIVGILDNYPEAGRGCAIQCVAWQYNKLKFEFEDQDTLIIYKPTYNTYQHAFRLMLTDKWPKGCTRPCFSKRWEDWDEWLCNSDAVDYDAFIQLACLGKVIYG